MIVIPDDMTYFYAPEEHDVLECDETLFHTYLTGRLEMGRLEKGKGEYFCMPSAKALDPPMNKRAISLDLAVSATRIEFNIAGANYVPLRLEIRN